MTVSEAAAWLPNGLRGAKSTIRLATTDATIMSQTRTARHTCQASSHRRCLAATLAGRHGVATACLLRLVSRLNKRAPPLPGKSVGGVIPIHRDGSDAELSSSTAVLTRYLDNFVAGARLRQGATCRG